MQDQNQFRTVTQTTQEHGLGTMKTVPVVETKGYQGVQRKMERTLRKHVRALWVQSQGRFMNQDIIP